MLGRFKIFQRVHVAWTSLPCLRQLWKFLRPFLLLFTGPKAIIGQRDEGTVSFREREDRGVTRKGFIIIIIIIIIIVYYAKRDSA